MKNVLRRYWSQGISVLSFGLSLMSIITVVCCNINLNLEMISTVTILCFVGILATFVVMSNYSQVQDMKKEVVEKEKGMKSDYENFKNERQGIVADIKEIKEKMQQYKQPSDFLYGYWINNRNKKDEVVLHFFGTNSVRLGHKSDEKFSEYNITSYDENSIKFEFKSSYISDMWDNSYIGALNKLNNTITINILAEGDNQERIFCR